MMIGDSKKLTFRRRGFTMLEIMIVVAVFSILITGVLIGLRQQMHLTTLQQYNQQLDTQGSRLMQELTVRLRPAILPVWTNSALDNEDRKIVFELLDKNPNGFRAGEGRAWRDALIDGVDSIAFVVPVAADGGSDAFDAQGRMTVGQRRADGVALDCEFTLDGPDEFVHDPSGPTSPTSSLVRVSPDLLANDGVGGAANIAGWPGALYAGTAPATSAFSVIRYVPVLEGGTPALIVESDIGVDLNGDGVLTSIFNIGKLQLVNVGGTHAVRPSGGTVPLVMNNGVPHEVLDLSADFILRDVNPANRTPIFRLVQFSGDGNVNAGDSIEDGDPVMALVARVNLFDPHGNEILRTRAPQQQQNFLNREFETVLTLQNMAR